MHIDGKIGIGFRRDLAQELLQLPPGLPAFIELAPENWIGLGGQYARLLHQATERFPVVCHGLSLSIGSPDPLDWDFLARIKSFLRQHNVLIYSEHLSFNSAQNAHFYDLLPLPFRHDAVRHLAQRIRQVQDFLERPLALENVSYYSPLAPEMSEAEFISAIVHESGCQLLLDINNVYVNSVNHQYSPQQFLQQLPLHRVAYLHIAGHLRLSPQLILDTHGEAIAPEVFQLLQYFAAHSTPKAVLLERDFNFPPLPELLQELHTIAQQLAPHWATTPQTH